MDRIAFESIHNTPCGLKCNGCFVTLMGKLPWNNIKFSTKLLKKTFIVTYKFDYSLPISYTSLQLV